MYILIAGGGKVGANLTETLLGFGHEVTVVEQRLDRFEHLAERFEHRAVLGDATELYVLERAGIGRPPDVVVAATGDDEDNIVISQVARERYGVEKVVARVNDPRNEEHFDLLGIGPTVSATANILAMIQHEVPEHEFVQLLALRRENIEIVEVQIEKGSPSEGKRIERIKLPPGSRVLCVMRDGKAEAPAASTQLRAGDQVLAMLEPGDEDALRRALLKK